MKYFREQSNFLNQKQLIRCVVLFCLFPLTILCAQVQMPAFFADDMVLQQQDSVSVWGWDTPYSSIVLKTSWGSEKATKTDSKGNWEVQFKTPQASFSPHQIQVDGSTSISINNVLIGEVWFCSGQSNMEMPMKGLGKSPVENAAAYLKEAKNPNIRLFNTERAGSLKLENDVTGQWASSDSTSVANFSAVGYLFGKKLFDKLQVPIGIIEAAWGGTRIEAWLPRDRFTAGNNVKIPTVLPDEPTKRKQPTQIYNAMIHPFQDLAIRGFLWYQGETNRTNPKPYKLYLHALIQTWRSQFNDPELPFYIVQIAPYAYEKYRKTPAIQAALIREAQLLASQEIPHIGLVVTADVGHCSDIHPPKKEPIAARLSYWALHHQYGFTEIEYASPVLATQKIVDNSIRLSFTSETEHKKVKLTSLGGPLNGFTIAGIDKIFHPAVASIAEDGSIIISSDAVSKPLAVRYGFDDCFEGNLYGNSKLPVSPFRTDAW